MTNSVGRKKLNAKSVGSVIEGLWPDLPQVEMDNDFLNRACVLHEYRRLDNKNWQGGYFIMRCTDANGVQFTTATSGQVVARKLAEIEQKNAFPVEGMFTQKPSSAPGLNGYFDFVPAPDTVENFELAES